MEIDKIEEIKKGNQPYHKGDQGWGSGSIVRS